MPPHTKVVDRSTDLNKAQSSVKTLRPNIRLQDGQLDSRARRPGRGHDILHDARADTRALPVRLNAESVYLKQPVIQRTYRQETDIVALEADNSRVGDLKLCTELSVFTHDVPRATRGRDGLLHRPDEQLGEPINVVATGRSGVDRRLLPSA
jgi:hypothetical protein